MGIDKDREIEVNDRSPAADKIGSHFLIVDRRHYTSCSAVPLLLVV